MAALWRKVTTIHHLGTMNIFMTFCTTIAGVEIFYRVSQKSLVGFILCACAVDIEVVLL